MTEYQQECNKKTIDNNIEFEMTREENNAIHYLDLTLHRQRYKIDISIHRKPTSTDTTIHYISNQPYEQKMTAFRFYIHRMTTLPIITESRKKE